MRVVFREMAVNQLVGKGDAFAFQSLQDEVVDGPEVVLWEGSRAQSVLVAHHDELEVEMLGDESEVAEHPFRELQFAERVDLLILGLLYESAIAVDEK